mmetsp:Transcript_5796/g.7530  ORF Transcript_5796/g.7530 Transcript_5796/m.7530 type:complete len:666 (-) Transcript_5796:325-2322(-)
MEELQDAIEDAQYVNAIAMVEEGPRPVLAWEIPSEEAVAEWREKVRKRDDGENGPEGLGFDWTVSHALGFFLFSAYLKEKCDDYVRINFVEEVARWRINRSRSKKMEKARKLVTAYFMPRENDEKTGEPTLPPKTEIEEHDLERKLPSLSEDEMKNLYDENFDLSTSKCCIGLDGPIRDAIVETIFNVSNVESDSAPPSPIRNGSDNGDTDKFTDEGSASNVAESSLTNDNKSSPRSSDSTRLPSLDLPNDFFDQAEAVVMESLRKQYWEGFKESPEHTKLHNFFWYRDRKTVEDDFFVMRVLGRGGFGLVTACKKGTSGKLYAMKVMNKKRIKIKKSEQLTLNERQALAAVDSPFVVNLKYSFQSKDDIFLILDLMTGGDLNFHLGQKGRFPKKECLYYAARIMLGLQALHDQQYVYRDLKPENCLLGDDGRVKITDLGLATKVTPTLHGAAGTRGYWAPEMLRRDNRGKRMPYGYSVDWFSFGCVVAEMISGINPFRSERALNFGLEKGKKTKEKAIDCATLEMDPFFDSAKYSDDAADLCRLLLDKDEKTRLGANGCKEIMAHPWFKDVNWEMIITDRKRPPYIPPKDVNAASQSEIGTFAEDKTFHETVLEEKDEEVYKNWDWTNPKAFDAEVIEFLIYERETGEPLLPIQPPSSCCCVIS